MHHLASHYIHRKICINCYCPREVHQVSLYAGKRGTESKDSLCHAEEGILQSYAWFPPGVDADMVSSERKLVYNNIMFECLHNEPSGWSLENV